MNEITKTFTFVGAAAVCLLGAWWGGSAPTLSELPDRVDTVLFAEFDDPYKATRMEVVSYDESLDVVQNFEVAQQSGQWVIPSHGNYPADAEERLKNAATLLIDLKVISVVTDRHEDHALYGVVQPDKNTTQVGEQGVGTLVSFRGDKNSRLAEIVIGKAVKGSASQHYVRKPGQDIVYTVNIDPSQISTKFEDWIEKDLLKISGFDIEAMEIRDYSVEPTLTPQMQLQLQLEPRYELAVRWNADEYRWDLDEFREYQRDGYEPRALRDNEELDRTNLDNMKNAIGDLQIVDVRRKPKGLRPGTESGDSIWQDQEAIQSLTEHGFYPQPGEDNSLKLYCSDGEVDIRTKDGVRYTLWFGSQTPTVDSQGESRLNRYVMISAAVDMAAFDKPLLELPPEPTSTPLPQDDEPATDEVPAAVSEAGNDGTTAVGEPETDSKRGDPTDATRDTERDRLIKEYEQKMDAYNDEVQTATEKARDLNLRLGDWYFVVDEDVYDRIRLRRSQVIKEKESAAVEAGEGVDAFRALQDQGLRPDEGDEND